MAYVPAQGDVVWIEFDPQLGHEQSGRRLALILSRLGYTQRTGLAVMCPITRKAKGYVFEVAVPESYRVVGAILADQVKNLDWAAREARYECSLPIDTVEQVVNKIRALVSV